MTKRRIYERHGVKEYWIVDGEARTVPVIHFVSGTDRESAVLSAAIAVKRVFI